MIQRKKQSQKDSKKEIKSLTKDNIRLHDKIEQLREELNATIKKNSDLTEKVDQINEIVIEKNTEIQKYKAAGFD